MTVTKLNVTLAIEVFLMNNPFGSLTDYDLKHLAAHLEGAGRVDELHNILSLETDQQRNAWFEAKDELGDTAGYLADVSRAWRLAEADITGETISPKKAKAWFLMIRYLLITVSINSLAKNVHPKLLDVLVEKGLWTPVQALAYANRIPEAKGKIVAQARLLQYLPEPLYQKTHDAILAEIHAIEDPNLRAGWLKDTAPFFREPTRTQLLYELIEAVKAIEGRGASLLTRLSFELLDMKRPQEALMAARAIEWEWPRIETLARMLPNLPDSDQPKIKQEVEETVLRIIREPDTETSKELGAVLAQLGYFEEALEATQRIKNKRELSEALESVAYYLPSLPLLRKVLHQAETIPDESDKPALYLAVASYMAKCGYPKEALEIVEEMFHKNGKDKAVALTILASDLSKPYKQETSQQALEMARAIEHPGERTAALVAVVPHLPSDIERMEILGEAMAALALTWGDLVPSDHFLEQLVLRLGEVGLFQHAFAVADTLPSAHPFRKTRRQVVRKLSLRLVELKRLEEAMMVTQILPPASSTRAFLLAHLAPHMSIPMLGEILATSQRIGDEKARDAALAKIMVMLAEWGYFREARMVARAIHWHYGKEFVRVALRVPEPLLLDVLTKAYQAEFERWRTYREGEELPSPMVVLEDEEIQASYLKILTPYLTEPSLNEALAIVEEFGNQMAQRVAERTLIPRLAELGHREQALNLTRVTKDDLTRIQVLQKLAGLSVFEDMREALIKEAYEATRTIKTDEDRVVVLTKLLPHLPQHLIEQTLSEILISLRELVDEKARAVWLIMLARLPILANRRSELLSEVLHIAKIATHPWTRVDLLKLLAPLVPRALLDELAEVLQSIEDEDDRFNATEEFILRQAELGYLDDALAAARKVPIATRLLTFRALILGKLALLPNLRKLRDDLLAEALEAAQAVDRDRQGHQVLVELIPYLPQWLLTKAKSMVQTVQSEEALTALALRLVELGKPEDALEIVEEIDDKQIQIVVRAAALDKAQEPLKGQILKDALSILREITYTTEQVEAIIELAPHLSGDQLENIVQELLTELQESWRTQPFIKLIKCIPETLMPMALEITKRLVDDKDRLAVLEKLVPRLPKSLQEKAVQEALIALRNYGLSSDEHIVINEIASQAAIYLAEEGNLEEALQICEIQSESDQAQILIRLALMSSFVGSREKLLDMALLAIRSSEQVSLFVELLKYLDEPKRTHVLHEALESVRSIERNETKATMLAQLAEYLPESKRNYIFEEIFHLVSNLETHERQITVLVELAKLPVLSVWREALVQKALEIALSVQSARECTKLMTRVVPLLPKGVQEPATQLMLVALQSISGQENKEYTLIEVLPCLASLGYSELALSTALQINKEEYKWRAFVGLIPHLHNSLLPKVLIAAREINNDDDRWEVLSALAARLAECTLEEISEFIPDWNETLRFLARRTRFTLLYYDLRTLIPFIRRVGGEETLVEVGHAIQDVGRWWP